MVIKTKSIISPLDPHEPSVEHFVKPPAAPSVEPSVAPSVEQVPFSLRVGKLQEVKRFGLVPRIERMHCTVVAKAFAKQ